MKPMDFPCFYMTDDTESLDELGLDYNIEDCDVKTVTFFSIDNVSEWIEGDKKYSSIRSGGASYICNMPRIEVVRRILAER